MVSGYGPATVADRGGTYSGRRLSPRSTARSEANSSFPDGVGNPFANGRNGAG